MFTCLGIETSCDETAAAVVRDGIDIRSSIVLSQVDRHAVFGGVVPELACRVHLETFTRVIDRALVQAGVAARDLDAIAVTYTPGLIGALLIGVSAAKALAFALDKPVIGINHIHAHIYAAAMAHPALLETSPFVSLVVSGGHSSLYVSRDCGTHELAGGTQDDAAGEAFDKVAAIVGLPYPGGPSIDKAAREGNPQAIRFPRAELPDAPDDFSFSGIKTAVLYHCKGQNAGRQSPLLPGIRIPDIAASFQAAMVDMLVERTIRLACRSGARAIAVGGGVACNSELRTRMTEAGAAHGLPVYIPPLALCTDNAAMIAGLAHRHWVRGEVSDLTLDAVPTPSR